MFNFNFGFEYCNRRTLQDREDRFIRSIDGYASTTTNVFQVLQSGVLDNTKFLFEPERTLGESIVNYIVIEINTMHLQVKFFSIFSPFSLYNI